MDYKVFAEKLNNHIKMDDNELYYQLLETIYKNPTRYTGIFRVSNIQTKLIQNLTQSQEIKFGDFVEEILTDYIAEMGYKNLNKIIGLGDDGNPLQADQVFVKEDTLYLIEQKMRDDHDSAKKRGQWENFSKKYNLLKNTYPNKEIIGIIWFTDGSLGKNKKYYLDEIKKLDTNSVKLIYGEKLFSEIFKREDIWKEFCSYLGKNKAERSNEVLYVPNFDTDEKMVPILEKFKEAHPRQWDKLINPKTEKMIHLNRELFPSKFNIEKIENSKKKSCPKTK